MATYIHSDWVKDHTERQNQTAPNFIELARNFRWFYEISCEDEYIEICQWAEEVEAGSTDRRPLEKIDTLNLHVAFGTNHKSDGRGNKLAFRKNCRVWVRDGFPADHLAFFESRFGDLTDNDALLRAQQEEIEARNRAAAEAEARRNAPRPRFDVLNHVRYLPVGVGDVDLTLESPVIVTTKLSVKPKTLRDLGAQNVRTWRQSEQRVCTFANEQVAFDAITKLNSEVNTVCRYLSPNEESSFVFVLVNAPNRNEIVDRFNLKENVRRNAYWADPVDETLMAIAHPEYAIPLAR